MTNTEILETAIKKAIDNGWLSWYKKQIRLVEYDGINTVWLNSGHKDVQAVEVGSKYDIIFNHNFAKALWGEGKVGEYDFHLVKNASAVCEHGTARAKWDGLLWQYHLSRMVIAPDPIEYLGENI